MQWVWRVKPGDLSETSPVGRTLRTGSSSPLFSLADSISSTESSSLAPGLAAAAAASGHVAGTGAPWFTSSVTHRHQFPPSWPVSLSRGHGIKPMLPPDESLRAHTQLCHLCNSMPTKPQVPVDWVKALLCPIQHKTGHLANTLPSQFLGTN